MDKAFQKDYVATYSTARHSATETNEMSGYGTVPCLSKSIEAQRIGLDFSDVARLVPREHVGNKYSLLKSSAVIAVFYLLQFVDIVNRILNYCTFI